MAINDHWYDRHVPLQLIFGAFAGLAMLSIALVLLIRQRGDLQVEEKVDNRKMPAQPIHRASSEKVR